jgi:hypothetical protein
VTREDFSEALLHFGADLDRWPQVQAEAARRLISADAVAAKMLADSGTFERTIADAVEPPPFGAAEIGAVLGALPEARSASRFSPGLWLAGAAGVSLLSFIAGFTVMQANLAAQDQLGVPLAIIAFAMGDTSVGGLM